MQWKIHFESDLRVSIESNPHIESLNRLFFELPIVRIPFFLDFFLIRGDFFTETCGIQFPENQDDEDKKKDLIESGFIKVTGHYTRSGFMEEDVFERLLLEFSNLVLLKFKGDALVQEKWEFNRRKEWFSNLDYYKYFIGFPQQWELAMEAGIRKIQLARAR